MIKRHCAICYKIFRIHNNREKTAKYCSFQCRDLSYLNMNFSPKTQFKRGQKFSKIRNKKISDTHQKNHKLQKRVNNICPICKNIFITKPCEQKTRIYCSVKCFHKDPRQIKRMIRQGKNRIFSKERNLKISKSLKGRLPANWGQIIYGGKNNKYWQKKMFRIIKKFFPNAIYEYQVKVSKNHSRFLDTAIIDKKIDFEYDGMIHLKKTVQKEDKIRERQLYKLGWKIIRFNKNNFKDIKLILKGLKNEL